LRGVAAPVRDFSGEVVAAIGISGPTHRMSKKDLLVLVVCFGVMELTEATAFWFTAQR
jgi:transcriptional regulator of acetoin/glycerol metabolism